MTGAAVLGVWRLLPHNGYRKRLGPHDPYTSRYPGKARRQSHSNPTQSDWSSRGDQDTLCPFCRTTAVHSWGRVYLDKWGTLRMVSQLIFGWKDLNMGFLFCFNFFFLFFFSQMAVMVQPTSQVRSRAANDYFTFAV